MNLDWDSSHSSKARKVANLKTFQFDKASNRIVQQQTKKLLVTRKYPLSVVTKTTMTEDVRKDPISIASTSVSFTWHQRKISKTLSMKTKKKMIGSRDGRRS
jgi:hypothetical protein